MRREQFLCFHVKFVVFKSTFDRTNWRALYSFILLNHKAINFPFVAHKFSIWHQKQCSGHYLLARQKPRLCYVWPCVYVLCVYYFSINISISCIWELHCLFVHKFMVFDCFRPTSQCSNVCATSSNFSNKMQDFTHYYANGIQHFSPVIFCQYCTL